MTGVVKSNRCGTCRDRKVKCDEIKPVCGPCQKGKRICKSPISKVKFARPRGIRADVALDGHGLNESQTLIEPMSQISILRSIPTTEGGSFQTMRIARRKREGSTDPHIRDHVPLLRRPFLSSVESLQLLLVQNLSLMNPGLRLAVIAGFIKEIPPMLGRSNALDDSIACFVNCHSLILHGQRPSDDIKQANIYAKALLSLQTALTDPIESYSDLTLGAVTILGYVEIFGGGSSIPQNVQHAGGASRLIEMRGPIHSQSNFAKTLYNSQRSQSIPVAILRNEECFFNRPEWRQISYSDTYDCETDFYIDNLVREFAALPALLIKIRAFYASPNEATNDTIFQEALQLRDSFNLVSNFVDAKLQGGTDIVETPSTLGDNLVPTYYQFSTYELANVCTLYWGISIILDTIIARFLPIGAPTAMFFELQDRCLLARQRICMSCEYSEQFRPLGTMWLVGPLILAYRGATAEEKTWIMHQLWQIGELMADVRIVWSSISLEYASKYFYGEPIILRPGWEGIDPYDVGGGAFLQKAQEQFERLSVHRQVVDWPGRDA